MITEIESGANPNRTESEIFKIVVGKRLHNENNHHETGMQIL